jgi:hypothetical protein
MRLLVGLLLLISFSNLVQSQNTTVRVNEFMADNASDITDAEGDFSDWIEFYNPTNETIDLSGWTLSDDSEEHKQWVFPTVSIGAHDFLIVFASGRDPVFANNELHTNFKLSASGEYLGFFDSYGNSISEFSPAFPELKENQSFGFYTEAWIVFDEATPGSTNEISTSTTLPQPSFSVKHGFYEQVFDLQLKSEIEGLSIYYTLDGSDPNFENGLLYQNPISISKTSVVRARVVAANGAQSNSYTQSYLFNNDIIHQNNSPEGYPEFWGEFIEIFGQASADYEMDPEIASDPTMAERTKEALKALPVMSLVSDKGNFFSTEINDETGGIYVYTGPPGREVGLGWERPTSMEYFDANSSKSVQVNCGIRLHGGHSRRPEKSPKHSFRLVFKSEYGPGRLTFPLLGENAVSDFNSIVLRAGYGNSWTHRAADERERAQNGRDTWSKDTQLDMGYLASHSIFVHLFINGLYWGIYNPGERIDSDFAESYLGGNSDDYDVIKDYAEALDGNKTAWNNAIAIANSGMESDEVYQLIQGNNLDGTRNFNYQAYIDVDNLIDYMLLNFYGGNTDWDHHNWVAIRNRVKPEKGFQFFAWDQEHVLKSLLENNISEFNSRCPSHIFQRLRLNENFRRRFADKVLERCTKNGVLTPEANRERWMNRSRILENAIDAESARWGDYRRDVHPYFFSDTIELYTKDEHWLPARDYLMNTYFRDRTNLFLEQLQEAELYPVTEAPFFLLNGIEISQKEAVVGDLLEMTAAKGTIYYTLNGKDPVVWEDGNPSLALDAKLYNGTISLRESAFVKARAFYNNEWSAMQAQTLVISADFYDLKITEINYNPAPINGFSDSDFEFIELKNTGTATIDLEGVKFVDGIEYKFPPNSIIPPNGFMVLAANDLLLYSRYEYAAFDEFKGQLANGGEKIVVENPNGETIISFSYDDENGWPTEADSEGKTMVSVDLNPSNSQNSFTDWRGSHYNGGSPGADDILKLSASEIITNNSTIQIQHYPNPFAKVSYIDYQLSEPSFVEIEVYTTMGEKLSTLESSFKVAGLHQVQWNGMNNNRIQLPNGVYIYRMQVKSAREHLILTRKIMLLRN